MGPLAGYLSRDRPPRDARDTLKSSGPEMPPPSPVSAQRTDPETRSRRLTIAQRGSCEDCWRAATCVSRVKREPNTAAAESIDIGAKPTCPGVLFRSGRNRYCRRRQPSLGHTAFVVRCATRKSDYVMARGNQAPSVRVPRQGVDCRRVRSCPVQFELSSQGMLPRAGAKVDFQSAARDNGGPMRAPARYIVGTPVSPHALPGHPEPPSPCLHTRRRPVLHRNHGAATWSGGACAPQRLNESD